MNGARLTVQPGFVPAPERARLEELLALHAPLTPAPLSPEVLVHQARSLVEVWEAAERVAGDTLPAPFWAYAWAGGSALARVLLDEPALVRGRRVIDFGAGGGVCALAAARAGAASVTANDIDPWALLVCRIAADAQALALATLEADLCADPSLVEQYDVVLCSDLSYERREAPRQQRVLDHARRAGATILAADAGRTYFVPGDMREIASYDIPVPADLEGVARRTARVFTG